MYANTIAAVAACSALALAGCSQAADSDQADPATAIQTATGLLTGNDDPPLPAPTNTSTATTTNAVDAQAAYLGYWRAFFTISAVPREQWKSHLEPYADEITTASLIKTLGDAANTSQVFTGMAINHPRVTIIDNQTININDCISPGSAMLVDTKNNQKESFGYMTTSIIMQHDNITNRWRVSGVPALKRAEEDKC